MGAAVSGGFLDRWSRRKREAAAEEESTAAEAADGAETPASPAEEDAEPSADLPSLDDLDVGSTLTPFLQKGVPAALKNAALRKMWLLDPTIRTHADVAVDYAWDWNTPGGVPGFGGTLSSDRIGRLLDGLTGAGDTAPPDGDEPQQPAIGAEVAAQAPPDEPDTAVAQDAPRPETEASAPPRRRHGGALPS